jgi:type IV fimbrial biogenesis protein FimT
MKAIICGRPKMLLGMKLDRARGFTLVEMMIALLVVAVVLAIGAPSFSSLIKNNRMLSQVYELRAVLNNARSEALAQRNFVTVCSSSDGSTCSGEWKDGYIAFIDMDGDTETTDLGEAGGDEIIIAKTLDIADSRFSIDYSETRIRFNSRGYATGFSGTFTLCDDRGAQEARGVILTPAGIVRAPEDRKNIGVLVDINGDELECDE